ncbi:unnamed protein product, partial [Mesorhabditis spiculigera]
MLASSCSSTRSPTKSSTRKSRCSARTVCERRLEMGNSSNAQRAIIPGTVTRNAKDWPGNYIVTSVADSKRCSRTFP